MKKESRMRAKPHPTFGKSKVHIRNGVDSAPTWLLIACIRISHPVLISKRQHFHQTHLQCYGILLYMLICSTPIQLNEESRFEICSSFSSFKLFHSVDWTLSVFTSFPEDLSCPPLQCCSIFSYSSTALGFNLLTPSHSLHPPITTGADFLKRPLLCVLPSPNSGVISTQANTGMK